MNLEGSESPDIVTLGPSRITFTGPRYLSSTLVTVETVDIAFMGTNLGHLFGEAFTGDRFGRESVIDSKPARSDGFGVSRGAGLRRQAKAVAADGAFRGRYLLSSVS